MEGTAGPIQPPGVRHCELFVTLLVCEVIFLFHIGRAEGFVEDPHPVPIGIYLIHGFVHSSVHIPRTVPEEGIHNRHRRGVCGGYLSIGVKGPVLFLWW